ncbi:hypothetical protein Lalb_Chr16g0377861 [Lupinus albus]|uniref:Uncharacterized protein n=1 Tax=Lupinus albus TaxID=3870 RepID=A0A6A4PAJ8_LUPAL|nr:hypothetical protein Lalb_Chr16g0377861 [Lupinus albus]
MAGQQNLNKKFNLFLAVIAPELSGVTVVCGVRCVLIFLMPLFITCLALHYFTLKGKDDTSANLLRQRSIKVSVYI